MCTLRKIIKPSYLFNQIRSIHQHHHHYTQMATPSLYKPQVGFQIHPKIQLNENELKIKNLLEDFCQYYNDLHPPVDGELNNSHEPLMLRITGGWVRDKLLGKESHDVDIAINKLSGESFATQLQHFMSENPQYSAMVDDPGNGSSKIHKIDKNPEKSKHLETVTTKLFDQSIDFVNLRDEEYADSNSRVPTTVQFGTAKQDALRRDATLNALFYNLTTEQIEDYTGQGEKDLELGVLRTPLEPLQTFLDDPLRILRLVRFAGQFGFKIDDNAMDVLIHDEQNIKINLLRKVSKERIGIEFGKLLSAKYPVVGLKLLNKADLYSIILNIDPDFTDPHLDKFYYENFHTVFNNDIELLNGIYNDLKASSELSPLEQELLAILDPEQHDAKSDEEKNFQRNFYMIFIFKNLVTKSIFPTPTYEIKMVPPGNAKAGKKPKGFHPIEYMIKECFHFHKHDAELVDKVIVTNQENLKLYFDESVFVKKSLLGFNLIRTMRTDDYWKLSLIMNYLETYGDHAKREHFCKIFSYISASGLGKVYEDKAVIDGKQLGQILNKKPGKWLREVNDLIFQWQLDHHGMNPEELKEGCIKYIKEDEKIQNLIN